MLKELIKIANELDSMGLTKEADRADRILHSYAAEEPVDTSIIDEVSQICSWVPEPNAAFDIFVSLKDTYYSMDPNVIGSTIDLTDDDIAAMKIDRKYKFLDKVTEIGSNAPSGAICAAGVTGLGGGAGSLGARITCEPDIYEKYCWQSEDEFASVLAHELSHIVLLHTAQTMGQEQYHASEEDVNPDYTGPRAPKKVLDLLEGSADGRLNLSMWRADNESKADLLSKMITTEAGYTPSGTDVLLRLQDPAAASSTHPPTIIEDPAGIQQAKVVRDF